MEYVSIVVAISVVVIVHELAHAIMMRTYGVEIKRFGVGLPIGPLPYAEVRVAHLPPVAIHPILLGAYVETTEHGEEHMKALPLGKRMEIYAAGVLANIFLFTLMVGIMYWDHTVKFAPIPFPVLAIAVCGVLFLLRRIFALVMPILGLGALLWIIPILVSIPDALMGPVGMASKPSALGSNFLEQIVNISFSLAFFNMIPMSPLDGGHATIALLERVFGRRDAVKNVLTAVGTALFIALIIWITFGDVLRLIGG